MIADFLLLILPALAQAPTGGAWEAVEVYRCDFEEAADIDYDNWPDGWTRRKGPGFPPFAKIGIVAAEDSQSGKRMLRLELDGGAVGVSTPPVPVNVKYSYFLEAWIRTEQLRHSGPQLAVLLQDQDGNTLETHVAPRIADQADWQRVVIGPVAPHSEEVRRAVISLEVTPRGRTGDLHGRALLDSVRLSRLPRMALETNSETHLFTSVSQPEVVCRISGIPQQAPAIQFQLLNERNEMVKEFVGAVSSQRLRKKRGDYEADDDGFAGLATWKPPITDYGFYRVRASLQGEDKAVLARETSFAVLRPLSRPDSGEFGWSLPPGEHPLAFGPLASVLGQAGIHAAKYPIWFRPEEERQADRIAWFAERLSIQGLELVGVFDEPPADPAEPLRNKGDVPIASVFIDPAQWQPAVDPVLTRLSLKIRHWQLGRDRDTSFIGFSEMPERLKEIKQHLERFGQEVRLGVAWEWLHELPSTSETPTRFVAIGTQPALTAAELAAYLEKPRPDDPARWIILDPLPRSQYAEETRAQDLVQRMLAGKIAGAAGMFASRPFSTEHGVMNDDGTPGDLFLPWRTTAMLLGGADYLGTLRVPGESKNHLFARDGLAVMLIWNDRPTTERVYLGDDVRQLDLWGRETTPPTVQHDGLPAQEIQVGPLPTFLVGVNEMVARWRIQADFETRRLASVFGKEQNIELKLFNPFPQSVSGEATLHAPATWNYNRQPLRFKLADGGEQTILWPTLLQPDANSGPQEVRVDFNIRAERQYQFSIMRTLSVGLDDVTLEMNTRLNEEGRLLVNVHLTNQTEHPVSFRCLLFPPERKRETRQLFGVTPGRNTFSFELPAGESLLGKKLQFRAEEIGGPRVLNYSVMAER
jgi:hypothetical protein